MIVKTNGLFLADALLVDVKFESYSMFVYLSYYNSQGVDIWMDVCVQIL